MKKALIVVSCLLVAVLAFLVAYDMVTWRDGLSEKPVLYLYPQEERQLTVTLDLEGSLDTVYPAPDDQRATDRGTQASWTVTASPDGTLTDASGRTYPSLFWDGPVRQESPQQGFVVAREDAVPFLEEKLALLGLSDRESADSSRTGRRASAPTSTRSSPSTRARIRGAPPTASRTRPGRRSRRTRSSGCS